jgi:hypothetical protein
VIKVAIKLNDNFTKQLKALGKGFNAHVVRSTARAGALEYYNTLMQNVPVGPTSNLKNSLYHAFADNVSTDYYKEYQVGFRGNYGKGDQDNKNEENTFGKSNHLHLVEFGYIQRYAWKTDKDTGKWITLVRPDKIGTKRPNPKKATRAEMDAYYILLKNPIQRTGSGFVRRSFDQAKNAAPKAMEKRASERLAELIKNPSLAAKYVS